LWILAVFSFHVNLPLLPMEIERHSSIVLSRPKERQSGRRKSSIAESLHDWAMKSIVVAQLVMCL
jgi:hypothetical protein